LPYSRGRSLSAYGHTCKHGDDPPPCPAVFQVTSLSEAMAIRISIIALAALLLISVLASLSVGAAPFPV